MNAPNGNQVRKLDLTIKSIIAIASIILSAFGGVIVTDLRNVALTLERHDAQIKQLQHMEDRILSHIKLEFTTELDKLHADLAKILAEVKQRP